MLSERYGLLKSANPANVYELDYTIVNIVLLSKMIAKGRLKRSDMCQTPLLNFMFLLSNELSVSALVQRVAKVNEIVVQMTISERRFRDLSGILVTEYKERAKLTKSQILKATPQGFHSVPICRPTTRISGRAPPFLRV